MDYYNGKQETGDKNKNSVEYRWDGNSYQAVYSQDDKGSINSQPPQMPNEKPPRKKRRGLRIAMCTLAAVLCFAVISGGTLAVFFSLINDGKIALTNAGTAEAPAYTITKLIESEANNASENIIDENVSKLSEKEVAEKILPSIVLIENYTLTSPKGGFSPPFASSSGDNNVSPSGEGSGIIASSDGYIITNAHVVANATSLKVKTYDGQTYEAALIGSDTITDLAIIKIEAKNLIAAQFGSSGDLNVGEKVIAAGNPGGSEFGFSITVGYVSALNRTITNHETGYSMQCIQTDAAVNPGNSGGALVNEYGMVVGIVSSKIVAESFEGLGFAIPIDEAQDIVSDLKNHGYVKDRAALGIAGVFVDSVTARFYGLSMGWYISSIKNDSLTEAGILKGDVITAIGDKEITSSAVIPDYLLTKKPGEKIVLTISRADLEETFTATVSLVELKNS